MGVLWLLFGVSVCDLHWFVCSGRFKRCFDLVKFDCCVYTCLGFRFEAADLGLV